MSIDASWGARVFAGALGRRLPPTSSPAQWCPGGGRPGCRIAAGTALTQASQGMGIGRRK